MTGFEGGPSAQPGEELAGLGRGVPAADPWPGPGGHRALPSGDAAPRPTVHPREAGSFVEAVSQRATVLTPVAFGV